MVLHDVKTEDFSRFLWVFYNPCVLAIACYSISFCTHVTCSYYSIYDASTEDWATILGLAHHWQFSEVKALVIRELEKQMIPSITKIIIYHQYGVNRNLLLPAYMELCQRDYALGLDEAKDLGLETSMMIMTAREVVRRGDGSISAHHLMSQDELKHIIRDVFNFPEPRSDTPLSDATAAEANPAANGSDLSDQNHFSDNSPDLPHIKTESILDEAATFVHADTTNMAPGTEVSPGDSSNVEQQPPPPPKEHLAVKDGNDLQTPVAGSQSASPITGQSVTIYF
jgi:hypothetical protein